MEPDDDPFADRPDFAAMELRLMHQWTVSTCKTLSNGEFDLDWFQTGCTQASISHTWLLNSIFAFTSLHLAALEPASALDHGKRAVAYHGRAITEFREVLGDPKPAQYAALFWASIVISITAFTLPRIHPPSSTGDAVDNLTNLSRLLLGCSTIYDMARDHFGDSWIKSFPGYPKPQSTTLKPQTQEMLDQLRALAAQADEADPKEQGRQTPAALYSTSVHMLRDFFEIVERGQSQVLAWPEFVGASFIDRLENGDALARLTTMFYGVLLLSLDRLWWAAGAGKQLVEDLVPVIMSEHAQWTSMAQWAASEAGL